MIFNNLIIGSTPQNICNHSKLSFIIWKSDFGKSLYQSWFNPIKTDEAKTVSEITTVLMLDWLSESEGIKKALKLFCAEIIPKKAKKKRIEI